MRTRPVDPTSPSAGPRRAGRLLAVLGLAAVAVTGCAGGDGEPSSDGSVPPPAALPPEVLLEPAEMPAWNGAIVWQVDDGDDGPEDNEVCPLPTLESLGASEVRTRNYSTQSDGADDDGLDGWNTAGRFADAAAAESAVQSLDNAMTACPAASGISDLPAGATWTASGPDDDLDDDNETRFEFVGFAHSGDAVTVIGFDLEGQDANWETDPLADSLDTAVARLQ